MPLDVLRRVVRYLTTMHIFAEAEHNQVQHTAISRMLATDDAAKSWIYHSTLVNLPAIANQLKSIEKCPEVDDPPRTGQAIAEGWPAGKGIFDVLAQDPARSKRFDEAMQFASSAILGSVQTAMADFDWKSLPEHGLVIDV